MSGRLVFSCERSGLHSTLGAGLMGGYDGFGLWRVRIDNIATGEEHLMVQTHEALITSFRPRPSGAA